MQHTTVLVADRDIRRNNDRRTRIHDSGKQSRARLIRDPHPSPLAGFNLDTHQIAGREQVVFGDGYVFAALRAAGAACNER